MPPRKLTPEDQAFVNYWSQKAFYFIKMIRRADVYVRSTSRERYVAAYKEFANSGQVIGGEWDNPNRRDDKRSRYPEPEQRDAYIKYLEDFIKDHPPTSPLNAAKILCAGNSGLMFINNIIIMEKSERVQDRYDIEFNKLNNEDLKEVYGTQVTARPGETNDIVRDPDEDPSNKPFVRLRPRPHEPEKMISPSEWKQFEQVGETYFVKDGNDKTGFTAFELSSVVLHKTGKFYEIRYEDMVDSIRISEQELLGLLDNGVWV